MISPENTPPLELYTCDLCGQRFLLEVLSREPDKRRSRILNAESWVAHAAGHSRRGEIFSWTITGA